MIQRVVMVRMSPEYREDEDLEKIAAHSVETLKNAVGVLAVDAARPADERTRRDWDLVILVRFDSLEAVEVYRDDPVHRKYVDVFLRPMMEKIRAWNFELA